MDATDVIVVGAGFAGLNAARHLEARGKRVVVVEARDRVGGRVETLRRDDGTWVDVGGQWVGPTQDHLYALAAEVGVNTFATHAEGKNVLVIGGRRSEYRGTIPGIQPLALLDLGRLIAKLDAMASTVPLDDPWRAPDALAWDRQTLATFLESATHFHASRRLVEVGLETVFACDAADVSLLFALFYIRSGGGVQRLLDVRNGAQQDRFVGGAQAVALALAAKLEGDVRLSSPVRTVDQEGERVVVSGDGFALSASHVVVAVPPPLVARIDFRPMLPVDRDLLLQRMPMGSVMKCTAIYRKPFWRDAGLSGQMVHDEGPIGSTFDSSVPGHATGMLMGFAEGNHARILRREPPAERRRQVLACLARAFGPQALEPLDYVDKSWAEEPYTRGCYAAFMPPGVLTSYGKYLRAPCGRIHWAGTETSAVWNGYIEGALRSGERVADEIAPA